MNLDMTLRDFFAMAERVGAAAQTIREAQAMMGGVTERPMPPVGLLPAAVREVHAHAVLRSTPQPNPDASEPPEGLTARGKTGIEIIAERQREEIRKRAEARGEVVELDPKLGLMDAEAQAVKARLRAQREDAERAALAKMTDEERREYEGRA